MSLLKTWIAFTGRYANGMVLFIYREDKFLPSTFFYNSQQEIEDEASDASPNASVLASIRFHFESTLLSYQI